MPRQFLDHQENSWALLRSLGPTNSKLAVFVHGFRGKYLATWGRLPDLLREHGGAPPFDAWDYLFLGYDSGNIETYLDISNGLATEVRGALAGESPYTSKYTNIALFGHSLGTLGIRQMLCSTADHPDGFTAALRSVTLFGTPVMGSPWAPFAVGYSVAAALEPANPQLRMLRSWVKTTHRHAPWPKVRIVLGQDDKVVGAGKLAGFVDWPGDAPHTDYVKEDHSSLVKPKSWESSTLVNVLRVALT